ncbi:4Fe-4S binding protein [Anaerovorax odorimutans]|uniref:4Fe-4S binding protein n=1 Tax=Anaerovorax odorimutans TaxID=109327 RepID=A0ABT1RSJ4_9FIRM|nr:4Fe-4S binding protein [Anaerovorax odorimutans]MCQ4638109.1 4Fe-4S binding protein [Anaerovorax odorimutans]
MKDLDSVKKELAYFVRQAAGNYINEEQALSRELAGMRIYDAPLVGAASVTDTLFRELKKPQAIGEHFMLPGDWMPEGKSVLSVFLPYTEEIKRANAGDNCEPAPEWLHGRVEGQTFLTEVCGHLKEKIEALGGRVLVPTWDERFWKTESPKGVEMQDYEFTSNWSERHVAYTCGLGTFGLSRGLITKAGIAGRLFSLITDLEFEPLPREYEGLYDYCTGCGACIGRCPADAISLEKGKEHRPCGQFMDYTKEAYAPRYGCGKCQTGVPCESGIPTKTENI